MNNHINNEDIKGGDANKKGNNILIITYYTRLKTTRNRSRKVENMNKSYNYPKKNNMASKLLKARQHDLN